MSDAFQIFKEFIGQIEEGDRIIIVRDDDVDGTTAGIQLLKFLEKHKPKNVVDIAFGHPGHITEDEKAVLEQYDKVIFMDVDVDYDAPGCMIVDHHVPQYDYEHTIVVKPDEMDPSIPMDQYCTSIMAYNLIASVEEMEENAWIAGVGLVGDSNDKTWASFYDEKELDKEKCKSASDTIDAARAIANLEGLEVVHRAFAEAGSIDDFLANKILKDYKNKFDAEFSRIIAEFDEKKQEFGELLIFEFESKYEIKSPVSNHLSHNIVPDKTLIVAHIDEENGRYSVSARRQDRKVSMNELMRESIKGIPGAVGGGHVPAGGALVPLDHKEQFLEQLKRASSN